MLDNPRRRPFAPTGSLLICSILLAISGLSLDAHASARTTQDASRRSSEACDQFSCSTDAFAALLAKLDVLDGGDLEDAYLILGDAYFSNPEVLTPVLRGSTGLRSVHATNLALTLPKRFLDNACAQRDELSRRMAILQAKVPFAPEHIQAAIGAIQDSIEHVSAVCKLVR